jgi:hypothetical protein
MAWHCSGCGSAGYIYGSYACKTSYNWSAGSGTHNCHNDTRLQMWGIRFGAQDQTGGTCSGHFHRWAPQCNETGW